MKIKLIKLLDQVFGRLLALCLPRPFKSDDQPVQSILLIRPGGIGDAVLLVPAVTALKRAFPDARVDVLAERRNFKVLGLCPGVDAVYCYDQPGQLGRLLTRRYSVVIDTEQWHRLSAVIARLIRSERKIGFATNERRRLFTDSVAYSQEDYEALSFLRLLQPLLPDLEKSFTVPFLQVPAAVKTSEQLFGAAAEPYVVIFPGASISERKWGTANFAGLAELVAAAGSKVVIVGGPEDAEVGEGVVKRVPAVINMAGRTSLLETASILKDATLLISGDSGVLHIGVGLGIPTVSLFWPGNCRKMGSAWGATSGHQSSPAMFALYQIRDYTEVRDRWPLHPGHFGDGSILGGAGAIGRKMQR